MGKIKRKKKVKKLFPFRVINTPGLAYWNASLIAGTSLNKTNEDFKKKNNKK